jgi:hypothetical protein
LYRIISVNKNTLTNTLGIFIEDLWQSLSEASGKDVEKVMHSWTKQMGFPVLTVKETQVTM